MNFTGNYSRSISRQDEHCAVAAQFIMSQTDNFSFGLSGSGEFSLSVSGNKIFDNNGNYIFGGQSGQGIFAKMYKDDAGVLTYVNNDLLSFSPLSSSYYDYLFFRSDSEKNAAIYVSGVEPDLEYENLNPFSSTVSVMTGLLTNNTPTKLYKILSGNVSTNTKSNLFLSGWTTGDIVESGYLYLGIQDEAFDATGVATVILYTNFGEMSLEVDIETLAVNSFDYLTMWPSGEVFFAPVTNKIYSTENYYNTGSRNLYVALEYVSGGASYPELVTYSGDGSGYLMGDISGSGYITGLISGYTDNVFYLSGISGFEVITGNFAGTFTGNGTGLFNSQLYTGLIISGYSLTMTSGDNGVWPGGVGTGTVSFSVNQFSGYGSYEEFDMDTNTWFGFLPRDIGIVSGAMINNLEFYARTDFELTIDDSVSVYLNSNFASEIFSGNFSGMSGLTYVYTGILYDIDTTQNVSGSFDVTLFSSFSKFDEQIYNFAIKFPWYVVSGVSVTGTGFYDPYYFTGSFNQTLLSGITSGRIESTGQINFTDIWNLGTGINFSSLLDFNYYNYYNSTGYVNTGYLSPLPQNRINSNIINVTYDGLNTSGVNIAKLIVSDGVNLIDLLISGTGNIL